MLNQKCCIANGNFFLFVHVSLLLQLVELNSDARMKLSQDIEKVTIPGKKEAYRLYGGDGKSPSGKIHNKAGKANHNTFSDFFKTQLENLKKLANLLQFQIHFHPRHFVEARWSSG